jgi:hypothetical protein
MENSQVMDYTPSCSEIHEIEDIIGEQTKNEVHIKGSQFKRQSRKSHVPTPTNINIIQKQNNPYKTNKNQQNLHQRQ